MYRKKNYKEQKQLSFFSLFLFIFSVNSTARATWHSFPIFQNSKIIKRLSHKKKSNKQFLKIIIKNYVTLILHYEGRYVGARINPCRAQKTKTFCSFDFSLSSLHQKLKYIMGNKLVIVSGEEDLLVSGPSSSHWSSRGSPWDNFSIAGNCGECICWTIFDGPTHVMCFPHDGQGYAERGLPIWKRAW